MGQTNASDIKEKKLSGEKVAVNSLQTTALVRRICVQTAYNVDGILTYDSDNLYPQKVLSIIQRSWAATSASKTLSDFITGDGFADEAINKEILNEKGQTGYDLLRFVSDQKSKIGFSFHVNYNIQGQVSEINYIDFEDLRVTKKGTLVWRPDWSKPMFGGDIEYNLFNPNNVIKEIQEAGGIENYNGQVIYWTGTNKVYPLAQADAAIDSAQYQAESELFKLRNLQNDFTGSGAFQYPANLDSNEDFKEAKLKLKSEGTGANNAGTIVLVGTTADYEGAKNLWHPFERSNVDKLYETQNKEAKETIFSVLRQPMILGAINPGGGWLNAQEMEDAFIYYNSIVEQDRKEVEKTLKKVFDASVWAFEKIEILPKVLIKAEAEETKEIENGIE